jgi:hypothetical protein
MPFGGEALARRRGGFRVRHGTADLRRWLVLAQPVVDDLTQ